MSWFDWHGAEFSLRAWWETKWGTESGDGVNEGQVSTWPTVTCPLPGGRITPGARQPLSWGSFAPGGLQVPEVAAKRKETNQTWPCSMTKYQSPLLMWGLQAGVVEQCGGVSTLGFLGSCLHHARGSPSENWNCWNSRTPGLGWGGAFPWDFVSHGPWRHFFGRNERILFELLAVDTTKTIWIMSFFVHLLEALGYRN